MFRPHICPACFRILTLLTSKFGLEGLSKVAAADLSANIVSTLQAGCFVGALGAYPVADKWGRKPSLLLSAVIAFVGIVMQFASDGHIAAMYVGR